MSTFEELSKLIMVSDICESFIGEFDKSQSVESVWEEWIQDLCGETLDPMDQFALVKSNQKTIGWIGFEDLDSSKKTLWECMETIRGNILMSSDTSLLDAIHIICRRGEPIYLVLKGNKFIGWLHYDHFHKLPFRMCLFALLIDLERILLEIIKYNPTLFLRNLNGNRLDKAKKIYKNRGFSLNKESKEFDTKLIECTAFCDKFVMLREDSVIVKKFPSINNKFGNKAEKIRNDIAHPKGEKSGALPIKKEIFIPFIEWAEELRQQLDKYVQINNREGVPGQ